MKIARFSIGSLQPPIPRRFEYPKCPRGLFLPGRTEGDATFARELLCANDIILQFVNLEVGQSESKD